MARLAYYAPGVYVEEVPSARQPIAGVGTNTAGFIGLVNDRIHVPVANPDYDPFITKTLLDFKQLSGPAPENENPEQKREREASAKERRSQLEAGLKALEGEIQSLDGKAKEAKADADKKVEEVTKLAGEREGIQGDTPENDKERATADRKLEKAQREQIAAARKQGSAEEALANAQRDAEKLKKDLESPEAAAAPAAAPAPAPGGAAAAAPAAVSAEQELDYEDAQPDADLLRPSRFRPYYLKPFDVRVDEFATKLCTNFSEYAERFGDFSAFDSVQVNKPLYPGHHYLTHAVRGFFENGGTRAFVARVSSPEGLTKALDRFESIDDVAILAAPGLPKTNDVWEELQLYCEHESHQNVFAVLDSPAVVNDGDSNDFEVTKLQYGGDDAVLPRKSAYAAFYFPHVEVVDPAKRLQDSDPARNVAPKYRGRCYVAPSGHVAGIYARTDEERGVHKAPANATVRGALEVKYYISKPKQELLNPQGVNCIRLLNGNVTVWGARTIGGDWNGEWKYVSVRRFAGFLEESIDEGTQWVVFEPNDPNLWSKIILNITSFLTNVWRSGALFGLTPQEAFYVKCDAELNPPEVRDLGQVITEIGVAIVRPAEFVIFRITQSTGMRQG
jgi:uncharacterized protein